MKVCMCRTQVAPRTNLPQPNHIMISMKSIPIIVTLIFVVISTATPKLLSLALLWLSEWVRKGWYFLLCCARQGVDSQHWQYAVLSFFLSLSHRFLRSSQAPAYGSPLTSHPYLWRRWISGSAKCPQRALLKRHLVLTSS